MKIRTIEDTDLPLIQEFTKADPWHKDKGNWQNDGLAIEDDKGVIFFIFFEQVARVHIQFGSAERERVREALGESFEKITKVLKKNGVAELIYQSENPSLVNFVQRYGYQPMKDEYSVRL